MTKEFNVFVYYQLQVGVVFPSYNLYSCFNHHHHYYHCYFCTYCFCFPFKKEITLNSLNTCAKYTNDIWIKLSVRFKKMHRMPICCIGKKKKKNSLLYYHLHYLKWYVRIKTFSIIHKCTWFILCCACAYHFYLVW
jgi:hypothetical protein